MRLPLSDVRALAVLAMAYALAVWALLTHDVRPALIGAAGTAAAAAAIVLCAVRPLWAFALAFGVALLAPFAAPLAWAALAPLGYAQFRIAADRPGRTAGMVLIAAVGSAVATALPDFAHTGAIGPFAVFSITAWVLGQATGQRRRYSADLVRQQMVDERMRIARELHDVVAHSMSVITVQAAYGNLVVTKEPLKAQASLHAIETVGRQTMTELRQLLGVLRTESGPDSDAATAIAPSPGLNDLPDLLARIGRAGVRVELIVSGRPRALPPGVELSAYRILQEALTNVVKHAGTDAAEARLDYQPAALEIVVIDGGSGRPELAPDCARGHGLLGIQERVGLYGGTLSCGRTAGPGFRVVARLPMANPV